jgi:putative ABC transport system ATP-binding protein
VVLADEPTGELDAKTGRGILDLFRRLSLDGVTLVVVTHDERLAAEAGRVVHMLDGRIVDDTSNAGNGNRGERGTG